MPILVFVYDDVEVEAEALESPATLQELKECLRLILDVDTATPASVTADQARE